MLDGLDDGTLLRYCAGSARCYSAQRHRDMGGRTVRARGTGDLEKSRYPLVSNGGSLYPSRDE